MLKIRLARSGKKNAPTFRIVLQESTRQPKGKNIELLGFCNFRFKQKSFKTERIKYWLSKGAQPTDTVRNLLIRAGIIQGAKVSVHKQKKTKEKADKQTSKETVQTEKIQTAPSEDKKEEKKEEAAGETKKPKEENKP